VLLNPLVGGKPLPPNATRLLQLPDVTSALLDDIDRLSAIGNVELLLVGRGGGVVDTAEIRRLRGFAQQPTVEDQELAELSARLGTQKPVSEKTLKEWGPLDEPVPSELLTPGRPPAPPLAPALPEPEILLEKEHPPESDSGVEDPILAGKPLLSDKLFTREELEAMQSSDLRELLKGEKTKNKSKSALIDMVLERQ
jgi:hypothetical protein